MNKSKKIELFKIYILFGFIAAIVYHYILAYYLNKGFPRNTFLFNPDDRFADFTNVYIKNSSLYFPFSNLIINLFNQIKPINISIVLFSLVSMILILSLFYYQLKEKSLLKTLNNIAVFSFCTFPFLFLFDRLNYETFVYIFCSIFILSFIQKRDKIAMISLSFAISMKFFPIMFLILYLIESKYFQILITIVISAIITLVSIQLLGLDFIDTIKTTLSNASYYQQKYVIENAGLDYGHSLYGLLKCILIVSKRLEIVPYLVKYYYLIILPIIIFTIYFMKVNNIELWKKVTLITIIFCLLPSVSADYKLLHFYTPIFLYINTDSNLKTDKYFLFNKINANQIFIFLYSLLLIPKNYRFFTSFVYDGVYIDPIILILIYALIISSSNKKRTKLEIN